MTYDAKFHLSHDAYDRFKELLAPFGVTVRDTTRHTTEDLETGSVSGESRSGFFLHGGQEFAYERQKTIPSADFPWHLLPGENPSVRVFRDGILSLPVTGDNLDAMEKVFDILEQIFPDPPRQQQQSRRVKAWTSTRLFPRIGCFIFLGLFAAFCFFAAYGIRAIFYAP